MAAESARQLAVLVVALAPVAERGIDVRIEVAAVHDGRRRLHASSYSVVSTFYRCSVARLAAPSNGPLRASTSDGLHDAPRSPSMQRTLAGNG